MPSPHAQLSERLWPDLKLFLANGTGAFSGYAKNMLAAGTATALIAVWPAILNRQEGIPFKELGILVLLLGMTSLFWIFVATQLSLKNSTLPTLREE